MTQNITETHGTRKILNLTQRKATRAQVAAGVYEPNNPGPINDALFFESVLTEKDIIERAAQLADHAEDELTKNGEINHEPAAMIGGAQCLMSTLEDTLIARGITPLYPFAEKKGVEDTQPDRRDRTPLIFHVGTAACMMPHRSTYRGDISIECDNRYEIVIRIPFGNREAAETEFDDLLDALY